MNKVEDAVIKYAIDFERYKNGQANEIIELLDKANKDVAKFIKETDGVYTKARYKEIAKKLKDVSATLKENVDEHTDLDGLIDYELRKEKKLLELAKPYIKKVKGGEVNFLYPSREQIKTSALFKPITTDGYGMTYQSYLDGIETGLFNTWDSAVRTGYLTGQTAKEITRNVLGSASKIGELIKQGTINSFRNNVYSNTRTVLQSFANETMQRVYEENEKYFGDGESDYKYEYLATLDSRTCLVCGEADGKLYKTLKDCPHVPQHRGCRCMILPYFNIENDTRASKTGQIDSKLTFENWLKEQDAETQKDVLGKTRYELFKRGESISSFVDNGKITTLEELAKDVFYSSGIEETLFNKIPPKEMMNAILEKEVDYINKDNYFKDVKDGEYQTNCTQCVHAFELRMRGYDVVAKPAKDKQLSRGYNFLNVYKDYKKELVNLEGDIKQSAIDQMKKWGNGSRAEIRISTDSKGIFGHVFSVINQNGNIIFIDSQQGVVDSDLMFNRIRGNINFMVKVNKLDFTEDIKYYVSNRKLPQ